jgi:predicted DsbA family dithiol-disulfide isomerase
VGKTVKGNQLATLKIDIVSDVVCPWCYLGKARLERALAAMKDVKAHINWRPYQLDATIPRTGVDRKAYMEAKFGTGPRLGEIHQQLVSFGKEVGIDFQFDKIMVSPNTMNAHRLIRWAAQAGAGVQDKVVDRLFRLYFTAGADIGDSAVLMKAGKECGMDSTILETLLPTDAEVVGVNAEIETSRKIGVTGVPFFIFNQKYGVSGAQTPDVLIEAMQGAMKDSPAA